MASATLERRRGMRKGPRVSGIRKSGFLKVSHALRRCFIAAKTATPETVRVTGRPTETGWAASSMSGGRR
jgi:hypothetical protein